MSRTAMQPYQNRGNGREIEKRPKLDSLKALLEKKKDEIAGIVPRHLSVDRLLKLALITVNQNPRLLDCTTASVMQSVLTAAQVGLEIGGPLQEGYLIPYKQLCQFQPSYRGLVKLARQSGEVTRVEARVVYAGDEFEYSYGLDPILKHRPCGEEDRGEMSHVYAIAFFRDGSSQFDVMTKGDVDRIRARSRSRDDGPWVTDFDEMSKKTVLKRLSKLLPASPQLSTALAVDNAAESGGAVEMIDGMIIPPSELPPSQADEINRKLKGKSQGEAEPQSDEPIIDPTDAHEPPQEEGEGDVDAALDEPPAEQPAPAQAPARSRKPKAKAEAEPSMTWPDFYSLAEGEAQEQGVEAGKFDASMNLLLLARGWKGKTDKAPAAELQALADAIKARHFDWATGKIKPQS